MSPARHAELLSSHRYEVLIVGGGPAGSTLAWALTRQGLSVAVMDKAHFPRNKVCAGWVTPAVMEELEVDPLEYGRAHVLQPIHSFLTGIVGQKLIRSEFPGDPVSYGIRRTEFDDFLLRRSGAKLILGQAYESMERDGGRWRVNGDIEANLVVGAGGHFCPVARSMRKSVTRELAVAAQEVEFKLSSEQEAACSVAGDTPELFFTPDLKGYGWVFRKGDYLNVGLGREDKHKLSGHVERFCERLKSEGKIPMDLPVKFRGHAYLLYHHASRRLVDDAVLLIGDSAGLAYPQSGEGIRPAVESALLAAQVVGDCRGDYRAGNLQAYVALLEARFGQRDPSPGLVEKLPARSRQAVARWLLKSRWFSRNILTARWFLHAQQRALSPPPS